MGRSLARTFRSVLSKGMRLKWYRGPGDVPETKLWLGKKSSTLRFSLASVDEEDFELPLTEVESTVHLPVPTDDEAAAATAHASPQMDEELCFVIRTKAGTDITLEARTSMEMNATVEGLELLRVFTG